MKKYFICTVFTMLSTVGLSSSCETKLKDRELSHFREIGLDLVVVDSLEISEFDLGQGMAFHSAINLLVGRVREEHQDSRIGFMLEVEDDTRNDIVRGNYDSQLLPQILDSLCEQVGSEWTHEKGVIRIVETLE